MSESSQAFKYWIDRAALAVKSSFTSRKWPDRPEKLAFEITSICDSKCIHCPRHEMDRPMRPMEFELFKKMIDQAVDLEIPELCPNGYGEIMTLRNMDQYFSYISSKGFPFRITINTNAFRMTDEKIETLIRHKVSLLNICIDGATAETFENIRIGLKLQQIEDNVLRLMKMREERNLDFPKVRIGFVKIPQNEKEIPSFIEKWTGKVDFVGTDGFSNRLGGVKGPLAELGTSSTESIAASQRPSTCVLPFKELNIWADGKAVLCCNDWNEEAVVGDLNIQSITEIWHGAPLKMARHLHRACRGGEMAICAKCNYWQPVMPGSKLWE